MSLTPEAPEPIEQREDGNTSAPRSRSAIVRKRIMAAFILVLFALMNTIYLYERSAYLRSHGDWSWFWIGEAFIGIWLVYGVVQLLRKGP
jgi:hypothetical protein